MDLKDNDMCADVYGRESSNFGFTGMLYYHRGNISNCNLFISGRDCRALISFYLSFLAVTVLDVDYQSEIAALSKNGCQKLLNS